MADQLDGSIGLGEGCGQVSERASLLAHTRRISQEAGPPINIEIERLKFGESPRISGENVDHIERLAEIFEGLPPIIVHRETLIVIDGLHRVRAAQLRGEQTISAWLFGGEDNVAFLIAVEANVAHGLPLSLSERKIAAERLLKLFPDRSDRSISVSTGLSDKTVASLRSTPENPHSNTRAGTDGRRRPTDRAFGRRRAAQILGDRPSLSVRDVAKEAGISLGTALDVRRRLEQGLDPVPGGLNRRAGETAREHATMHRLTSAPDPRDALERLRSDPALRSTESGRDLLRWLHTHVISVPQSRELAKTVPPHCSNLVAAIAQSYGEAWHIFARQVIEARQNKGQGQSPDV